MVGRLTPPAADRRLVSVASFVDFGLLALLAAGGSVPLLLLGIVL
jgi:hypothetical protein